MTLDKLPDAALVLEDPVEDGPGDPYPSGDGVDIEAGIRKVLGDERVGLRAAQ